jgi:hypothetical protein
MRNEKLVLKNKNTPKLFFIFTVEKKRYVFENKFSLTHLYFLISCHIFNYHNSK